MSNRSAVTRLARASTALLVNLGCTLFLAALFLQSASASTFMATETPHALIVARDPLLVGEIKRATDEVRTRLIDYLGDSLSYRPEIHLLETEAEFERILGGKFPDWGAAAALPERQMIVIKSPATFSLNKSLYELTQHEYAHLALDHRLSGQQAPRWFDEGLAMFSSAEWTWEDNLAMSKAAVFDQFVPLAEIDQVNRFTASRAHVAYAQSYLAVKYLFETYGTGAVHILLDMLEAGAPLDTALMAATGSVLADFEKEFHDSLHARYHLVSLLMDTVYFWSALAAIVVLAAILNYRRKKRVLKQWEEDERLQSTDFDYGNPGRPESIDDDEPWRKKRTGDEADDEPWRR